MKSVKFGLLGLGRVVDSRILDMFNNELKQATVTAFYDKNKDKKNKVQKILNCKASKSSKEFFKSDFDYVYIATESGSHYKNILESFNNQKNVIVEKPPVLKVDQLIKLNNIAKKKKLDFFVVFQNRENKAVKYIKKIINKELKKIIFVNLSLIWSRPQSYYSDWHGNWRMDGGVVAQQGIHYIDLLNHLLGKPSKCVSYITNKTNKLQAEDTHCSMIIYKNNISCTVNLSTGFRPKDYEASLNIYCKDKIYMLHGLCCNKVSIISLKKNKQTRKTLKNFSQEVKNGYGTSHREVFQKIVNYRLSKKKNKILPLKSIETLDTLKLLNMMYKSFEKKTWINISNKNLNSKLGK